MASKSAQPHALLGLLECPFRKGYIEFEYEPGDTTAELRERIAGTWGLPVALGGIDSDSWNGAFEDRGLWAILCEDEEGAYFALRDDDQIPISFPKASTEVEESFINRRAELRWGLPQGLIHIGEIRRMLYASRNISFERDEPDRHLLLELHREYEIPTDKQYSVRLIALIVIRGG